MRKLSSYNTVLVFASSLSPLKSNAEGLGIVDVGGWIRLLIWLIAGFAVALFLLPKIILSLKGKHEHETLKNIYYSDGSEIKLGDRVYVGETEKVIGTVVFVGSKNEWRQGFSKAEFPNLGLGFLVKTDNDLHYYEVSTKSVVPLRSGDENN